MLEDEEKKWQWFHLNHYIAMGLRQRSGADYVNVNNVASGIICKAKKNELLWRVIGYARCDTVVSYVMLIHLLLVRIYVSTKRAQHSQKKKIKIYFYLRCHQ